MRCIMGLLLLLSAGCRPEAQATREWTPDDHGHPPAPPEGQGAPQAPQAPEQGGSERAALALWNVSCAGCHGRSGRGDGTSPPPGAQMPDFSTAEFQASRSDAELVQAMKDGKGMMPSFSKQLNDDGFAALVQLIRRFGPSDGAPPPSAE